MPPQQTGGEQLLQNLLDYDLSRFAARLGLAEAPSPLPDVAAASLLNVAEGLSRSAATSDHQKCLVICGLLWEHRNKRWEALPQFVMNLLSRIGLAPSMHMVNRGRPQFEALGSLITEASIQARTMTHEVRVAERKTLALSEFQHRAWQEIDRSRFVGISAPTSAGKSFVLLYKALDILSRESAPILYIVPTLSLIQQVTKDFHTAAQELRMTNVHVHQTYTHTGEKPKTINELTHERALSAITDTSALTACSLVVIDEVQNVERAADQDDERAHTLFDVVQEVVATRNPQRAVISGPRVENIAQLTQQFFGPKARSITQDLPPVVNVTYAFARSARGAKLRQLVPGISQSREIEIADRDKALQKLFGKQQYSSAVMDLMADLLGKIALHEGTLIFSPTANQATKTARALAERGAWTRTAERVNQLKEYVEATVHERYALIDCLDSGVAYHHGKMPNHIRVAVEQAFSSLDVHVLACTTTLMQGVNLPAKNLIARNPNLFVRRYNSSSSLTSYEFANLRGRAGRLLKDFVGRAIILDESAFDQNDLDFDFPEKEVRAGYQERFEENRSPLMSMLRRGEPASADAVHADLAVYIRQAIYRRGSAALRRLADAGIVISDMEYSAISGQLRNLSIPISICAKAPYWDPVILDEMYREQKRGGIPPVPASPFAVGFVDSLTAALDSMRSVASFYYEKYLGEENPNVIKSIASSAQKWATQTPIKEIIKWKGERESIEWEEIDHRLERINKQVVYQIPKLLKPLVAMQDAENPILGLIELGAYEAPVRRLIELGLPRETAIRARHGIKNRHLDSVSNSGLIAAAAAASTRLNYWERKQIEILTGRS